MDHAAVCCRMAVLLIHDIGDPYYMIMVAKRFLKLDRNRMNTDRNRMNTEPKTRNKR